jgi:NADPH:quinone reductase
LKVTATTRSQAKTVELKAAEATHAIVDDGTLAGKARALNPGGYDRVLELVSATTLLDSLRAAKRGGIVCMTGILGGSWTVENFHPMGDVPTGVKLTSYSGETSDISHGQLQRYIALVEPGSIALKFGPSFPFQRLREAHAMKD